LLRDADGVPGDLGPFEELVEPTDGLAVGLDRPRALVLGLEMDAETPAGARRSVGLTVSSAAARLLRVTLVIPAAGLVGLWTVMLAGFVGKVQVIRWPVG
ncbi:MAG TPA: hypothetical protein VFZ96_00435, partial [Actinomycetota bacterium]|nr:hypothetical protein [Actinomycetota bacterium]